MDTEATYYIIINMTVLCSFPAQSAERAEVIAHNYAIQHNFKRKYGAQEWALAVKIPKEEQ